MLFILFEMQTYREKKRQRSSICQFTPPNGRNRAESIEGQEPKASSGSPLWCTPFLSHDQFSLSLLTIHEKTRNYYCLMKAIFVKAWVKKTFNICIRISTGHLLFPPSSLASKSKSKTSFLGILGPVRGRMQYDSVGLQLPKVNDCKGYSTFLCDNQPTTSMSSPGTDSASTESINEKKKHNWNKIMFVLSICRLFSCCNSMQNSFSAALLLY